MKKNILKIIRFYQKYISPDTGVPKKFFYNSKICRFTPSCSEYTYQAINKYGIIFGCWKGICRLVRCSQLNIGGFDPLK